MHGIMENDWMVSGNGIRPWHGIGTIVEGTLTSEEALRLAKMNWTVDQFPIFANGNEVSGYYANVRSDTNETLGVVKSRYVIHQNTESFSFVDGVISNSQGVDCRYETAGSLFNGKRVFLVVRLPNKNLLGDDVENYLFFSNSHDGSSSVLAGVSSVRVVCNNTLQLATNNATRVWKCRHTKNMESKKQEAIESLGLAVSYVDNVEQVAQEMAMKKINQEKFFKTLYEKLNKDFYAEKNTQKVIEQIAIIHNEKDDLQNFRNTGWGLYNAVADYYSNNVALRNTPQMGEKNLVKFFDGNKVLELSQSILLEVA